MKKRTLQQKHEIYFDKLRIEVAIVKVKEVWGGLELWMDALHFDLKEELWNSTQAKPIIPHEVAGLWIRK